MENDVETAREKLVRESEPNAICCPGDQSVRNRFLDSEKATRNIYIGGREALL